MGYFETEQRDFSQEEIEQVAIANDIRRLITRGERDWMLRPGRGQVAHEYILFETAKTLIYFEEITDGMFRKRWQIVGGIDLSGGIVHKGVIRGNEGFGVLDSAPFVVDVKRGEILSQDRIGNLSVIKFD